MCKSGTLRKMRAEQAAVVKYWFNLDKTDAVELNTLVGRPVLLRWEGTINCINCGREINKTFGQGFCYPCFRDAPQAAPCIMRPELCAAHLHQGRDVEWEMAHHNQPHVVYLALTSDVKVGVTRSTQVPSRWIDQGAWQALPIALTPYRQLAGLIELELKQYISDRTDWRRMLMGACGSSNLLSLRDELLEFLPTHLAQFAHIEDEITTFQYPVDSYPLRLQSVDLDKEKQIERTLTGIRGQYLMFDSEYVINLRKYSGYKVSLIY